MEWQPIESAPKDASRILVNELGDVVIAYWWAGKWRGPCDSYGNEEIMLPSHWMPLPEPPK